MPVAAIGIAAAASVGGTLISSNNNKKAINKATDAQTQVAAENNALARDIYGKNEGYLSPYVSRGNEAGGAINALLGISTPAPTPAPQQQNAFAYGSQQPQLDYGSQGYGTPWGMPPQEAGYYQNMQNYQQAPVASQTPAPSPASSATPSPYQTAFQNYQNSTGYQFRMGQGMNALNTGYAARGLLNSGAAQKAALQYGQNIGSAEFGNYLGYLSNQQGVGLSGASALAGVGQNYVNSVSANNNNSADAIANAALLKAQNKNSVVNSIAGGIGSIFGGSSFGGGW